MRNRILAVLLLTTLFMPARAWAVDTLRILAWPGYADPDIVQAFEKQQGVHVEVTFVTTDDDLWSKASANGGKEFDVVAINIAELQRLIDRNLVTPLAIDKIPNTKLQLKRFRDLERLPGLNRDGGVYGIPYTYSEMGLISQPQAG